MTADLDPSRPPTALPAVPPAPTTARPGLLLRSAVLALLCGAFAWLARRYGVVDDVVPLFWWPAGIAFGGLLRWGRRHWPGVAVGLLLGQFAAGSPPLEAVVLAAAHTLAPFLGVGWLRIHRFQAGLPGRRDALLLLAALGGSAALAAALQTAWHAAAPVGPLSLPAFALLAWMGHAVGGLLATLPALGPLRGSASAMSWPQRWRSLAAGALALGATVLSLGSGASASGLQSALLCVPPVVLAALAARRTARPAALTLLLLGVASTLLLAPETPPRDAVHAQLQVWLYLACSGLLVLLVQTACGELRRIRDRWQLALAAADIGVAEWDLRGGRSLRSPRWEAMLAADPEPPGPMPEAWLQRVHGDDRPRAAAAIERLSTAGHDSEHDDLRLRTVAGWGWFEVQWRVAERQRDGRPRRVIVTLTDIGERRANEERQRLSARLFQHLHEGLLITDADLRVLDVNPTYSQIMGVSRHELLGTVPPLLAAARTGTPGVDLATAARHGSMWASLRATGTWRGEVVDRRRNGDPCALQVTISAVLGPDGQPRYHVLVISDITEQHLQRQRLERQALFDELTRLPNRARLAQMLADAMAAADREGTLLAVCYLDLDHFKPVNDRFGHAAGDRLLVELAHRLRGALRSNAAWSDAAARLGGDEFVLLLRAGTLDEARLAVERVLRVISQPYAIEPGAEPVTITASVGATVYPLDRSDADTLLRHADHAMYGAKQSGRNGYSFFDPEHSRRTEERVMAIGRVQDALDGGELELYFQPKVDMRRAKVLGVEALLRWNHPEHGLIPPAQFLPLIEHTGLSARLGDWVLDQALKQLEQWHHEGLQLTVSVNVSARHLQEPDFAQRLAELLARHPEPLGARLELEVLETAALADIDYTSALLERCRRLGVRFSLDDFGTGYSTLTYLKRLPVDVLKIDRSFVHSMLDDRQDLAIVEGVIGLARTFGCSVVAEGVELPAQARMLIEMGCDIGQGHGIASPMRAGEVAHWARHYRGLFAIASADSAGGPPTQAA